jgi:hypothetical protein
MQDPVRITVRPDGRYTLYRGETPLIFGLTAGLVWPPLSPRDEA